MERITEASPRFEARIAGFLWLMVIVTGVFAFVSGSSLIVRNNAAATATNILAHESLFRLGVVADLIAGACYMGVTVLLYGLLKPVNRSISLLAAFFGLAGVAIGASTSLNRLASLVVLGSEQYSTAFTANQIQAQALASLGLSLQGFIMSMVFFGLQCFFIGYLIVRSTFLPRIIGVLLAIGGACYVISSFSNFLSPPFGALISPFILPVVLIGEGSLTLWLLVKGINVPKWLEQASVTGDWSSTW